jgi:hypothetical protein
MAGHASPEMTADYIKCREIDRVVSPLSIENIRLTP